MRADRHLLAAGDERALELAGSLLERLAAPGRPIQMGGAGAAHYAAAVLDGIRTAQMHAESEARQLLEAYPNDPKLDEICAATGIGSVEAGPRAAWLLDDAVRLHAPIPHLAQGIMLELGQALDDQRAVEPAPRVAGFVHPDDIL